MIYDIVKPDEKVIVTSVDMWQLWEELRQGWLQLSYERSYSEATKLAYDQATRKWLDFLDRKQIAPWEVSTAQVREWQSQMRSMGLSGSTINLRLAACSSYYNFVINEVHLVDGVEYTAFMDASGKTRANPFRAGNLRKERVKKYGKAHPLPLNDVRKLFDYLESRKDTLLGSRNLALLTTYFLTAARNSEILRIKWGDIRPSRSEEGTYVFAWRGKGNQQVDSILPLQAYESVKNHLQIAGRWEPKKTAYLWPPIVTHGNKNLMSDQKGPLNRGYISEKNAVRILHTALRKSGVEEWDKYRVHDLRHTFARMFSGNLEKLQEILHHKSLSTTMIYRFILDDPIDNYSTSIWQRIRN